MSNREIMFRGISVNKGQFFYSMTISNGTIKRKMNCVFLEVNGKWVGIKPETVGQYTGIKDKHGVEIYEGDIIKWKEEGICFSVRWSQEDCGYICMRDLPLSSGSMNQQYLDHFEKIGNIHQNPELLEQK